MHRKLTGLKKETTKGTAIIPEFWRPKLTLWRRIRLFFWMRKARRWNRNHKSL